jgi:subtilisin family serine protease
MRKGISKAIVGTTIALGIHQVGFNQETLVDIYEGRSEFVVMNETGQATISALGAPITKNLEYIDGRVVKLNGEQAADLRKSGARVYRNRSDYKIFSAASPPCLPCGDPVEPPIVVPEPPLGNAGPVPEKGDIVPWGTAEIRGPEALRITGGQNVTVCVLDTGLDTAHPEFRNRSIRGKGFVKGNGSWEDNQGHGTHVASTVSALSDGQGMVGVSQAKLAIGKVLSKYGSGTSVAISEGIMWCTGVVKASIISMSLGSSRSGGSDPLIRIATDYAISKGVIIVAAAGNDGRSDGCGFPAANPGVHCVSAINKQRKLASFSTHGPDVDISAPGVGILGAKMGTSSYVEWDGTSMATPHVAAVWALALSRAKSNIGVKSLGLPATHQGRGQVDALLSIK